MLGVRNSFDPQQNIDGGVRHLRGLIDRFGNDLPMALAAYNAGEKAVVTHRGIPPFAETRDYVTRVLYYYDGSTNGLAGAPTAVYRTVGDDGTLIYTNIPPRGRR
jgi:soluble lytic murein transglycosylase-like protein